MRGFFVSTLLRLKVNWCSLFGLDRARCGGLQYLLVRPDRGAEFIYRLPRLK